MAFTPAEIREALERLVDELVERAVAARITIMEEPQWRSCTNRARAPAT